ncbi:MAG: M16 family metallopeptidase [Solirubrobacterales bacterium]
MNEFVVSNGIKIIYYPVNYVHSIVIGLYIRTGSRYEHPLNNGITHLLEHLHFRRMGTLSQDEIYYRMESYGSTLRATTYKDYLRFHMKVRPNRLKECINLFQAILGSLNWTESEYEQEKTVVLNQVQERDSYLDIGQYVSKAVWKGNALSLPIMGNEETINKIQLSDVIQYKQTHFNPSQIAFFITGCIDSNGIDIVNSELNKIALDDNQDVQKPGFQNIKYQPRKPDIHLINTVGSYLDVNVSFDVNYEDATREELILLNCILGEGVGSRLQRVIREKSGLTSTIGSELEEYEDAAVIHVNFSIHKKYVYDCLALVVETLNRMKDGIGTSDFDTTMPFYTENLWFWLDNPEELNHQLAHDYFVLNRAKRDIPERIDLFKQVNASRVMEIAKLIFKSERASLVVLGSTGKLTKKEFTRILKDLD